MTSDPATESRAKISALSGPGSAGQRVPRLFQKTDLLAVEQLDLEPGGPAAEAKGGRAIRSGRPARRPRSAARRNEVRLRQVARCQPGRRQVERRGRLLGVTRPVGGQLVDHMLVPARGVLEGQGGHGPITGPAGILDGLSGLSRASPDQMVGGLGIVHVPAAAGQLGQQPASLGV